MFLFVIVLIERFKYIIFKGFAIFYLVEYCQKVINFLLIFDKIVIPTSCGSRIYVCNSMTTKKHKKPLKDDDHVHEWMNDWLIDWLIDDRLIFYYYLIYGVNINLFLTDHDEFDEYCVLKIKLKCDYTAMLLVILTIRILSIFIYSFSNRHLITQQT